MKTFAQIFDSVKAECRITASANLDDWVKDVINQEYRTLCANAEYPELLVPFATLQITGNSQSQYDLPVGARQIQSLEYTSSLQSDSWFPLAARNSFITSLTYGSPRYYFRAGNKIFVFPFSSVTTDNGLRISYYKTVDPLVDDDDVLEVPDLEEPLIQRVIARVLRYHKDRGDAEATGVDAVGAEVRVVQ